jgi:hypothetical protein
MPTTARPRCCACSDGGSCASRVTWSALPTASRARRCACSPCAGRSTSRS